MFSVLLLLASVVVSVISGPAISLQQCKPGDNACVTKVVKAAYPLVLAANPEIGAEELDPMYQELIEGNLSSLQFKLFNTTTTGFRSCEVQKAKYDDAADSLQVEFLCPGFKLNGHYDINGRLIILPVQGNGAYVLETKKYSVIVDADLKTVEKNGKSYKSIKSFKVTADPLEKVSFDFQNLFNGQKDLEKYSVIVDADLKTVEKNGKSYKSIKSFKVTADPLEKVSFDFQNLFNGQKDLADAVIKFSNENWKEVAHEVQDPVFTANFKKVVVNANKYLKTISTDEYTAA